MHIDVLHWISHYGYFGVFFILLLEMIGIPFPAETTLTISGFEWTKGAFALIPLLLSASIGNIIGTTIAYGIGYYLGRPFIIRFGKYVGITERRLNAAEKKFEKFRTGAVLFSKFIAGIRVLVPYLAGINRMSFVKFTIFNVISAVAWAALFILMGRYIEVAWSRYHQVMHQYLLPGVILFIILLGIYFYLRKRKKIASGAS